MRNHSSAVLSIVAVFFTLCVTTPAFAAPKSEAAQTFKSTCAACHGPDANANTAVAKSLGVPNLHSAAVQQKSDAELHDVISNGKGNMPSFKSRLSEAQIKSLVQYIRGLAKQSAHPHK